MSTHSEAPYAVQDHRDIGNGKTDWHYGLTIRDRRNHCLAVVGGVDAAVKDDAEGNARLFAQAPAMRAALESARARLESLLADDMDRQSILEEVDCLSEDISQVIAAAKNESSTASPVPRIVICIEEGRVSEVYSQEPVRYLVADFDLDYVDPGDNVVRILPTAEECKLDLMASTSTVSKAGDFVRAAFARAGE